MQGQQRQAWTPSPALAWPCRCQPPEMTQQPCLTWGLLSHLTSPASVLPARPCCPARPLMTARTALAPLPAATGRAQAAHQHVLLHQVPPHTPLPCDCRASDATHDYMTSAGTSASSSIQPITTAAQHGTCTLPGLQVTTWRTEWIVIHLLTGGVCSLPAQAAAQDLHCSRHCSHSPV